MKYPSVNDLLSNDTRALEDYLQVIHEVQSRSGSSVARNKFIAAELQVSAPSVTQMLGKLQSMGLVSKPRRGAARLTRDGVELAKRVSETRNLMASFLTMVLNMDDKDAVDRVAHVLEHLDEPAFIEAIRDFIDQHVAEGC